MAAAESDDDKAEARLNLESVGKTIGAYTDVLTVDPSRMRQYTDAERLEADRLAMLMLDGSIVPTPQLPSTTTDADARDSTTINTDSTDTPSPPTPPGVRYDSHDTGVGQSEVFGGWSEDKPGSSNE
jgi:hypothetical protein